MVSGHDAVDPAGRAAGRGDEETFPFPGQMFLQAVRLVFFPEPAQALFLPQTVEVMPAVFLLQALRGNGKVDGMAGDKVHFEGPGHEQVFLEGEAPLLFHEVFDIVVPVLGRLPGGRAVHLQKKLGQLGIRADGSPVQGRGDAAVDGLVGPDDGMHVAAGQQGLDAQAQGRGLGAGDIGLVAHEEDMPPRQQHELAGQGHITEAIAERGPEPGRGGLHVFVPAREVYARMFAAREEEFPACHEQGFLERGEQHMAACGPGKLGDEQAVVLARIAAYQRAGGIVAQTVGLQPLLTEGLAQVLAGRTVKLEFHVSSSTGKDGHIRGDRGEGPLHPRKCRAGKGKAASFRG